MEDNRETIEIEVRIEKEGEADIILGKFNYGVAPRVGEYIWMPYNWGRKKEFGRAFVVASVAHHFSYEKIICSGSIVVFVNKVSEYR